jgi:hypothetical protein
MCGRYRSELTAQVMSGMKKRRPIMRALQISAYGGDPLNALELVDIPERRKREGRRPRPSAQSQPDLEGASDRAGARAVPTTRR